METKKKLEGLTVGEYFLVQRRIGGGSFGEVYSGIDQRNMQQKVAIKVEPSNCQFPQLRHESKVYQKLIGVPGFPKLLWYGTQIGYNILVIELLGTDLETLRIQSGGTIGLSDVLKIGDEMIGLIQNLHKISFVHRDIKPENFLTSPDSGIAHLHLIDFGLAKSFIDPITKTHIPFTEHHHLVGTARYASINTLFGCEQSRRDDLESIFYVLVYLLKGSLPWQGVKAVNDKDKCDKIRDLKQSFPRSQMYNEIPKEFCQFFESVRKLSFAEEPDYVKLRTYLRNCSIRNGFTKSTDWPLLAVKTRHIRTSLYETRGSNSKRLKDHKERSHPSLLHATQSVANVPLLKPTKSTANVPFYGSANRIQAARKSSYVLPNSRQILKGPRRKTIKNTQEIIPCPNWAAPI